MYCAFSWHHWFLFINNKKFQKIQLLSKFNHGVNNHEGVITHKSELCNIQYSASHMSSLLLHNVNRRFHFTIGEHCKVN